MDSNHRPHPYQGCALPTELQQHWRVFYLNECGFASLFAEKKRPLPFMEVV